MARLTLQAPLAASGLSPSPSALVGSAPGLSPRLSAPAGKAWAVRAHALDELPSDRLFNEMLAAYRLSGGLARLDTLARDAARPGLLQLIADGTVFSFDWHQVFWVPMFQFVRPALVPKAEVRQVLAELADVFDDWSLATWFSLPNCWLKNKRPVDLLDSQVPLVLAAARVDRFIANG
jgi:hypothetical protein